jgi:uncharacterized protein (DUF1800 family)
MTGLVLAAVAAGGGDCTDPAQLPKPQIGHVLNRIGYGPDAWSQQRIEEIGVAAYIDEQLHPERINDSLFEARIASLEALQMDWQALQASFCSACPEGRRSDALRQLRTAKFLRSSYSRRQLEAVLVDFWLDHFNVDASSGLNRVAVVSYERDAIRPHVLGRFEDMLVATARSPAMLDYLDNGSNWWEEELGGASNENYARELLELHTVGIEARFTQEDVVAVARAMTGWLLIQRWKIYWLPTGEIDQERTQAVYEQSRFFEFRPDAHDPGEKHVMGELEIPAGGGMEDGLALLSFLANHPRTAERVSASLIRRFVSETPPPQLVAEARDTFLATGGDLRAVMRTILTSPDFLQAHYREKIKRPLVLAASLVRATRADLQIGQRLLKSIDTAIAVMGEPLYRARAPIGFPDDSTHWASSATIFRRFDLIHAIARNPSIGIDYGRVEGNSAQIVDALVLRLLPAGIEPGTRVAVTDYVEQVQRRDVVRIGEAAAMILSTPEFLKH